MIASGKIQVDDENSNDLQGPFGLKTENVRRYVDYIKLEDGKERDLKMCNNPETPKKSNIISTMSSDKKEDNELN